MGLRRVKFAEVLDFGYPQNTDPGVLKTFITQTGVRTVVGLRFLLTPMSAGMLVIDASRELW